jgi:tRNA(fMet)-specific endonuclease VapC
MKYLLDTNAVTAWAKKEATFIARLYATPPVELGISVITEHEIRYGIACNPSLRLRTVMERLLNTLPSAPVTSQVAACAATLRADLRRRGVPIGHYDLLIAATGLTYGLIVITHNAREFNRVPGLQVEDWQ